MPTMATTVKISTNVKARFALIIHLVPFVYAIPSFKESGAPSDPLPPFYHEKREFVTQNYRNLDIFAFSPKLLLTSHIIDDTIGLMKLPSFRQQVAYVTMVAVLFSTAAPMGICRCVGCHCEKNISLPLPDFAFLDFAVNDGSCCCVPPKLLPVEECCGLPEMPCPCSCCNIQQNDTVAPAAILSVKQPNFGPSWVLPAGPNRVSEQASLPDKRWALLPPHVPLYVLLCVFLN